MIKIEVTGNSLGELADKLIAIGDSLRLKDNERLADKEWWDARKQAKAEKAYAPPAEPVEINPVAPAAPAVEAPAPVVEAPALSFDKDVAPVVLRAVATKGKPFVENIMTEFGVERASQMDAARWPELIDRLESPF
jgi:hypothetical protein